MQEVQAGSVFGEIEWTKQFAQFAQFNEENEFTND